MCKKVFLLVVGLTFAASASAAVGDPYIGEVATSWATTNAVTGTAGTLPPAWVGAPIGFGPTNMLTGYAFDGAAGPATKPAYEGATYNTDGRRHSYSVTGTGWLGDCSRSSGLTNPAARPDNLNNNYSKNWISFEFDRPYEIISFDIWNGSYCGGPGSGGDLALMDVYIDYKTNGVWLMATNTVRLAREPEIWDWFPPTDNIAVGLKDVTQVVITPTNCWSADTSWYYGNHDNDYWTPVACVSEIRFYVPPRVLLTATLQGVEVTVSWPATNVGYILQSSASVIGGIWTNVSGVVDNSVTIRNANATGPQFYRLTR